MVDFARGIVNNNGNNIKPGFLFHIVFFEVSLCSPYQKALFGLIHKHLRLPESKGLPGFYLNNYQIIGRFGNNINFIFAKPPVGGQNLIAFFVEMPYS